MFARGYYERLRFDCAPEGARSLLSDDKRPAGAGEPLTLAANTKGGT